MLKIQILNSFRGDDLREISTDTDEGRAQAAKLLSELMKSGAAVFLEREIDGDTRTYRVTGYDPATDRIMVQMPMVELHQDSHKDKELAAAPIRRGRGRRNIVAALPSSSGRAVSVAPVSGGVDILDEVTPESPRELTWEGIRYGVSRLAEERGWHHGCPMPSSTAEGHPMVVARGAPLHDRMKDGMMNFGLGSSVRVCKDSDIIEDAVRIVNRWTPDPVRVEVYRDSKGSFKQRWPTAHERLKFWMDTIGVRAGAVDWTSEITAMQCLQPKLTDRQWASYVLSGAFPEKSSRSGVTYILRRGFPTIAITERPLPDGKVQRRFLAALCLHPLAYFVDTWAGAQPPSDEVIAHLMMIRTDEHDYWKRAGQHPITDPRAAI